MPKTKKRKNYFAVELEIQKLLNVPYVSKGATFMSVVVPAIAGAIVALSGWVGDSMRAGGREGGQGSITLKFRSRPQK